MLLAAPRRCCLCPPHPSQTDLCQLVPGTKRTRLLILALTPRSCCLPTCLLVRLFILEGIPSVLLGIAMLVSVLLGCQRCWWRHAAPQAPILSRQPQLTSWTHISSRPDTLKKRA